jgi:hypothetical protein
MKLINATLHDKQIKSSELPDDVKQDIEELKDLVLKFNDAVVEYNSSDKPSKATEQKLDAMEDNIVDVEKEIVEKIKAYEKPADPVPDPAPVTAPASDPAPAKEEKKGDSGVGWLVFSAVALAVTLGAVNLFKKKA